MRTNLIAIGGLSGGGAEIGIATLLKSGFLKGTKTHVVAFIEGDGRARAHFETVPGLSLTILYPGVRKFTPKVMLGCFLRYPVQLLRLRPALVCLSLIQANLIGRFWAHLIPFAKTYAFEHNTRPHNRLHGIVTFLLSLPVRGILADCRETIASMLPWYLLPARKTLLVTPLVSFDGADPRREPFRRPLRLVSTGRLHRQKNFAAVIRSLPLLRAAGVEAHYTIFGQGPDHGLLRDLIRDLDLEDEVTLAGFQPNWQRRLKDFDVYLQPSLWEGLCITTLEAMARGMPIVATPVGGIRSYGVPNQTYHALPADPSPGQIAGAICELAADPARAAGLGLAAHRRILQRYSCSQVDSEITALNRTLSR